MIKKFRKVSPFETEAVRFTRHNWGEVVEFTNGNAKDLRIERKLGGKATCYVVQYNGAGIIRADEGDWIVKSETSGQFYPIKADIFEKTYEPI